MFAKTSGLRRSEGCALTLVTALFAYACGSPPQAAAPADVTTPAPASQSQERSESAPAAASVPATPATEAQTDTPKTRAVPKACADSKACFPPSPFVDVVCKRKSPDLPLHLFAQSVPFRHLYVKAEWVEPVNPHGGEQSETWMHFGEEVLVLRERAPAGGHGVQTSGPSDLDVLRWDGTCATIRAEMLVSYVTAPMDTPRVIWKYLSTEAQNALLQNGLIARARDAEKKSCRDSSVTHPTPPCAKAMQKLTDAIVLAVHQNVQVPETEALPEWSGP